MQTLVITGASDGIRAELARQLAAAHGAEAILVLQRASVTRWKLRPRSAANTLPGPWQRA